MVTFAFYVSGHGFGHASRQVEVMNALGKALPTSRIVVRTAASPDLLGRTLRVPCEVWPGPCDPGIAQRTSVEHDDRRTLEEVLDFYDSWESRVTEEADRLAPEKPAVVIGDIPPLAFAVAARLGVPSVAIANFTWDWIYDTQPGFGPHRTLLSVLRNAYRQATLALRLPLSDGFDVFERVRSIPFIARQPVRGRHETRRHFGFADDERVALLSFGGYGMPALDLARLDCLDTWRVVTTDRVTDTDCTLPARVVRISEDGFLKGPCRYEDLVRAVDVVVTKPGYGIIADCIAAGTAMLYTSRGSFREYDLLVDALPRHVRSSFISQDDLFAGRWREALDSVLALPPPGPPPPTDGAAVAASAIAELAAAERSVV
jgi:hypothetical protein